MMDFTISKINSESAHELVEFYKKQSKENLSDNIIAMYSDIEGLKKRLENNIDIIYKCEVDDTIVGVIATITNKISNPENDSWTIISFYVVDQYKDTIIPDSLIKQFIEAVKETTAFKITTTFPEDDIFQQIYLIKNGFKQEGYFKDGIKRGRDLVSYSFFLD